MKEKIIAEIKRVANELETPTLTRAMFKSNSQISAWQIYKHFESWNEAIIAAGLEPIITSRIDDELLWEEMYNVFQQNGVVNRLQFDKLCKFSVDTYKKRFGSWSNILSAFRLWLEDQNRSFEYFEQLPNQSDASQPVKKNTNFQSEKKRTWSSSNGVKYGNFLNFRGLQHAPVNEQGVVFLFGMIAFELGYFVEVVQTGFPDCEAKRRVSKNTWERVRIEFEFKSSNFKEHGHNINGCDLIICWEHNWFECPIEVLELKTAIENLES